MFIFLNKLKQVKRIKSILFVLVVLISFSFANNVFGWDAPSALPPSDNKPTPLNVGATEQTKTGALTVGGFYLNGDGNEGNISNLNIIKGYDDLFIWGNAAETAPIYLSGSKIEFYTGSTKRLEIDGSGNMAIGTLSIDNSSVIRANSDYLDLITDSGISNYINYDDGSDSFLVYSGLTPSVVFSISSVGNVEIIGTLTVDGESITSGGLWEESGVDDEIYYNLGNLGIGITNPVSKFHAYQNDTNDSAGSGITIEQDGTGDAQLQLLLTGDSRWVIGVDNSDANKLKIGLGSNWVSGVSLAFDGSNHAYFGAYDVNFAGGTTYKVESDGDVVFKDVTAEGNVMSNWTSGVSGMQIEPGTSVVSTLRYDADRFRLYGGQGANEALTLFSGSPVRVGVNQATPAYTLDVGGDINLTGTLYQNDQVFATGYWTQGGTDLYYTTGKVGIGVSSPTTTLDVNGTITVQNQSTGDDPTIYSSSSEKFLDISGSLRLNSGNLFMGANGIGNNSSVLTFSGSNATFGGELTSTTLHTGNSILRDGSSAYVFGTKLYSLYESFANDLRIDLNDDNNHGGVYIRSTLNGGSSYVDLFTIERDTGDVGIGTNDPAHTLDVAGTGHFSSRLTLDSGSYQQHLLIQRGSPGFYLTQSSNSGLLEAVGTTDNFNFFGGVMKIETGGNVGIGNTNPVSKLQVKEGFDSDGHDQIHDVMDISGKDAGAMWSRIGAGLTFSLAENNSDTSTKLAGIYVIENGFATSATGGGALGFYTKVTDGSITQKMKIMGDGKVGIGVNTDAGPEVPFHVYSTDTTVAKFQGDDHLTIDFVGSGNSQITTRYVSGDITWMTGMDNVNTGITTDPDDYVIKRSNNGNVDFMIDKSTGNIKAIADLTVGGSITMETTTRYYSINAADFMTDKDEANVTITDGEIQGNYSNFIYICPIHLPHGAIVTEVRIYSENRGSYTPSWYMTASNRSNSTGLTMASGDIGFQQVADTTISNATINNLSYSYSIYTGPIDDCDIFGGYIKYTITQPYP